ncbi:MAG TPA: hypothetical protein VHS55_02895 [Solirubrobacteraceae bacterium]|nr:hypothetical protein [Solirubrobacteraceae bacterium]
MLRRLILCVSALLLLSVAPAAGATTKRSTTTTTVTNSEAPVPVEASDTPPVGRFLSANQVLEIAGRLPKMRAVRAKYHGSYGGGYLKGPIHWQVSYFSKQGKEIGQVIIADHTGRVLEQWTGFQIAWSMARGYSGAFGRHVNALYIWIPLSFLFFAAFFDWRRPFRLLHFDLLVLLSFSASLAFFNHGRIYVSTPLAYPPLLYLLVRMLAVGRVRLRRGTRHAAPAEGVLPDGARPLGVGAASARPEQPARLLIPAPWLAIALVFLVGFRVALNVTDSNVIDVGYAGVIGAQRIVDGKSLYGSYPSDNEHGDTYGPVSYESYIPFEQVFGFSGHWDDLPAAHAAAIVFDLLAIALLFLLGRRVRGPSLGIALAYAWAAYPFTLFTLQSNSNDTLVAVFVLAALLLASSPPARGVFAALAGLAKFAPLALAPLLATHGLPGLARARQARALALFCGAFLLTAALVSIPALTHDSLHTIYQRTLVYQSERESPFSIWGLYGVAPTGGRAAAPWLSTAQAVVEALAIVLALALALLPRRADLVGLAACAAAILIAVQLGIDHWFYLYIPWFFGLVMLALLGQLSWAPEPRPRSAVASAPARSSQLAAA